uniref:CP n=4 Tax=Potato yellow vein virus TaxID=103881 RepID=A0A5J6RCA9_9CLOS|nr:CP [Potato yellow vein virus]QKO00706.1 CP [Potato yellow vein virus]
MDPHGNPIVEPESSSSPESAGVSFTDSQKPPVDRKVKDDSYNLDLLISNVGRRDDIISPDDMSLDKLSKIQVRADRGDVLNDEDKLIFEGCLKNFCKRLTGVDPDPETFLGFFMSVAQMSLNQSTSVKNRKNLQLKNYLKIGDKEYVWKTADLLNYLSGQFPNKSNPLRQYMRLCENQIEMLKSSGKIVSDGHLAAKHGTTSQYFSSVGDYVNGSKTNISDDDLTANYLFKNAATKSTKKTKSIYNVAQLAGSIE